MAATGWDKFFWADWQSDIALRLCSLAAQGLWMRMLCVCAQADPKGYMRVAGKALGSADIAALCGRPEEEVIRLLEELQTRGVFSRDRRGVIYNRRMIRDTKKARIARENGSKGGNPTLCKQTTNKPLVNRTLKGDVKPRARVSRSQTQEEEAAQLLSPGLPSLRASVPPGSGPSVEPIVGTPEPPPAAAEMPPASGAGDRIAAVTPLPPPALADPRFHAVGSRCLALVWPDGASTANYGVVAQWLADGADPERDIYPTLQRLLEARRARGQPPPRSLHFFTSAIGERVRELGPRTVAEPGARFGPDEAAAMVRRARAGLGGNGG